MHIHNVIAVGSFAIVLPLASVPAQNTSSDPAQWSASLGIDPTIMNGGPGESVRARVVANLTRTWQTKSSPLASHLSLMVGGDTRVRSPHTICVGCWDRIPKAYAGLTTGTSLELFRGSRFSPYARTGLGLYYTKLGEKQPAGSEYVSDPHYFNSGFSLGVNGGLGLKARLWSREFFIEQSAHAFDIRGSRKHVFPFSIGVRF